MILLDTGYLVALFDPSDSLHSRALAWTRSLGDSLLVTEYVLWECVNYFSKPEHRSSAHELVKHVESDPGCELVYASRELFQAAMRLHHARADKEWSLTDCVSFNVMRERGMTLAAAYDEHFEQAGFVALLRKDPP